MITKETKVYVRGTVGKKSEIEKMFKKLNIVNNMNYNFSSPGAIYYVNKDNEIRIAEPGSDLHYIISTSKEWVELKPKNNGKSHRFMITLIEGNNSCDGCQFLNKCSEKQKNKCLIANKMSELIGTKFNGKGLEIERVEKNDFPTQEKI